MAEAIELADNRATKVFGTGFGLAMLMLIPVLLALLGIGCSLLVDAVLGPREAIIAFAIVIALVVLPFALSSVLDRRLGARLDADATLAKILRRVIEFYGRLGFGRRRNMLVNLFLSNQQSLRGELSLLLILLPVLAIVVIPRLGGGSKFSLGSSMGSPVAGVFSERNTMPAFYGNLDIDRSTATPVPYVSDRIARDAYLPLFVPFIPSRHVPLMRTTCPAVLMEETRVSTEPTLSCIALLSDIRIDGIPVPVNVDASSDPQTGQPGVLAMLPMQGLAQGRHELSLAEPGPTPADARHARRYRIPFWK